MPQSLWAPLHMEQSPSFRPPLYSADCSKKADEEAMGAPRGPCLTGINRKRWGREAEVGLESLPCKGTGFRFTGWMHPELK